MKKLKKLLESENGILELNKFTTLRRRQKDALNNEVDALEIVFSGESYSEKTVEIETRDVNEILDIINKETEIFFKELTEKLAKNLKNGYITNDVREI